MSTALSRSTPLGMACFSWYFLTVDVFKNKYLGFIGFIETPQAPFPLNNNNSNSQPFEYDSGLFHRQSHPGQGVPTLLTAISLCLCV